MPASPARMFEVNIYYSSYCTYRVEAKDDAEAIAKARKLVINENDTLETLKNGKKPIAPNQCNNATIESKPL